MPSALKWRAASLLEEVGEALSTGSLEAREEFGVTAWGEEVEGAMVAYVLDEPTPSEAGGAPCWAGMEGLATTVVMVASWIRQQRGRQIVGVSQGSLGGVRYTMCRGTASTKED